MACPLARANRYVHAFVQSWDGTRASPTSSQLTAFSLEDLLALCYNLPMVGVIRIYLRIVERNEALFQ